MQMTKQPEWTDKHANGLLVAVVLDTVTAWALTGCMLHAAFSGDGYWFIATVAAKAAWSISVSVANRNIADGTMLRVFALLPKNAR